MMDHYARFNLGEEYRGTMKEIPKFRRFFLSASLIFHPDKTDDKEAADKFNIFKGSYDILSDAQQRHTHNQELLTAEEKGKTWYQYMNPTVSAPGGPDMEREGGWEADWAPDAGAGWSSGGRREPDEDDGFDGRREPDAGAGWSSGGRREPDAGAGSVWEDTVLGHDIFPDFGGPDCPSSRHTTQSLLSFIDGLMSEYHRKSEEATNQWLNGEGPEFTYCINDGRDERLDEFNGIVGDFIEYIERNARVPISEESARKWIKWKMFSVTDRNKMRTWEWEWESKFKEYENSLIRQQIDRISRTKTSFCEKCAFPCAVGCATGLCTGGYCAHNPASFLMQPDVYPASLLDPAQFAAAGAAWTTGGAAAICHPCESCATDQCMKFCDACQRRDVPETEKHRMSAGSTEWYGGVERRFGDDYPPGFMAKKAKEYLCGDEEI